MNRFFEKEINRADIIINGNFIKATQKISNMITYLIENYDFKKESSLKKELENLLINIDEIIIKNNIPLNDKKLVYRDINIHYELTISYVAYWLQLYKDKEQITEIQGENIDTYIRKYENLYNNI